MDIFVKTSITIMLKHYFFAMALIVSSFWEVHAQINIGSFESPNIRDGAGMIRKGDVRRMEHNKTIFFYGEKDEARLEDLKKALKGAWDLNSLEFDHIRNFKKYERERNTAFITLEVSPVVKVNTNIGKEREVDCKVYLLLWVPKSRDRVPYARIELYPEHEFVKKLIKVPGDEDKKDLIYKEGKFYNDSPGLLSLYFRHVSKGLSIDDNITAPSLYDDWAREDSAGLGLLRNEILYVPDYVLIEEDLRDDTTQVRAAIDLFEDYPHRYEILKREQLSNLILEDVSHLNYVFVYVQSGEEKHFSIFNTKGEILFHEFEGNSFNLQENDIREMARSVGD
ncbi:MAG TPA: hypothetical protein DCG19_09420 [Cryomorphaceae bacterium]|nr:hypothetical protein [Cryomorphaceae bacterium]